ACARSSAFSVRGLQGPSLSFALRARLPIDGPIFPGLFHAAARNEPKALDAGDFSRALVTNGATVVLLSIPISRFLQRWSPATGLTIAAICTGTGFFLTQFAHTTVGYAATIFVWTLGEIAIASTTPALISRIAPPGQQGVYQASYSMSWSCGILFGPTVGGLVLPTFGEHALWSGCGILGVLAAVGFWFLLRKIEVSDERTSTSETEAQEPVLEPE
ncbi:MAG TPA: MFS transporter, partial [Chthoniobacterales bacterium]|nr:MFS transporter [Chthoniobacterales bacterium]